MKRAKRAMQTHTHVSGIKQGNSKGNYESPGRPPARRALDRRAVDRDQREGARADRPADAEPLTGVGR